ncbi:FecR family protein [Spirosoma harenae]
MSQYDFDTLVQKYLAGEATPEEERLMHEWSERMLEQSTIDLSPIEKQAIKTRIWQRVYTSTLRKSLFLVRNFRFYASAVAASVLLLLVGLFVQRQAVKSGIRQHSAKSQTELSGTIHIANTSAKPQKINLNDGSVAILSPRSDLSYQEQFGAKTRELFLHGEAIFDVVKDPSRPFIVHTGNLVTQVLGTRFTIKSYDEDKAIEVQVARGKVSVYEATEKSLGNRNGVILIPNQKITFDKLSQKLTPALVEAPHMIQAPENKTSFVFDRVPLTQVLNTLNKAYGIDFIVENQALNQCAFNGDLNDLPLFLQLDLICKSLNARYERRGTSIFINGEGCLE